MGCWRRALALYVTAAGSSHRHRACFAANQTSHACEACQDEFRLGLFCSQYQTWSDCYDSREDCCLALASSAGTSAARCLRDSSPPAIHPCDHFVGLNGQYPNEVCEAHCKNLLSPTGLWSARQYEQFAESCVPQYYLAFNREVVPTGQCYDNLLFLQLKQPEDDQAHVQTTHYNVDTPIQCQNLCQITDYCQRWSWSSAFVKQNQQRTGDQPFLCTLHSAAEIAALSSSQFAECTAEWALVGESDCLTAPAGSERCGGKDYCVSTSLNHIGGWKFCNRGDRTPSKEVGQDAVKSASQAKLSLTDQQQNRGRSEDCENICAQSAPPPPLHEISVAADCSNDAGSALTTPPPSVETAPRGLILNTRMISAAELALPENLLPQIFTNVSEIVPTLVIAGSQGFVSPVVMTSADRGIVVPRFELRGTTFSSPLVLLKSAGVAADVRVVVGNRTVTPLSHSANMLDRGGRAAPLILNIAHAEQSNMPVIIVLD